MSEIRGRQKRSGNCSLQPPTRLAGERPGARIRHGMERIHSMQDDLLTRAVHHVPGSQLAAAAGLDLAVDPHLAGAEQTARRATGVDQVDQLER